MAVRGSSASRGVATTRVWVMVARRCSAAPSICVCVDRQAAVERRLARSRRGAAARCFGLGFAIGALAIGVADRAAHRRRTGCATRRQPPARGWAARCASRSCSLPAALARRADDARLHPLGAARSVGLAVGDRGDERRVRPAASRESTARPSSRSLLVTLAGFFLAACLYATRSLYAAWMAHFAWNWTMAVVFHAAVSGYPAGIARLPLC